ncbi:MAG: amidophosphoribosyltransferase, partial [Paramuribaculum sp.]|nr:amidophosphoribosyltransferase [Paramuribaculum sp.]
EELEGSHDAHLDEYATTGSPRYEAMVERIREQLKITSLKFSSIENVIQSIGLPKCKVCTHCFDGSSYD